MRKNVKVLFLLFALLMAAFYAHAAEERGKLDLNTATLEQISSLPITQQQAQAIYNYRTYVDYFHNIYELNRIAGFDQATINSLKPLVQLSHMVETDSAAIRREQFAFVLEQLDSSEGANEAVSDVWSDYLATPRYVNNLTYSDLVSFPGVSPVDAAAVMKRIAEGDSISTARDLRETEGLSYYGYKNLSRYLSFIPQEFEPRLYADYTFKYTNIPLSDDVQEMYKIPMNTDLQHLKDLTYWGYFDMDNTRPEVLNKLRLRWGGNYKAGVMTRSEKLTGENWNSKTNWSNSKYYAGVEQSPNLWGNDHLKFYLGNYQAVFGQGLVMENTDFYTSRKTGYGFDKRILGISPDLSTSQEYNLQGGALQWQNLWLNTTMFYSHDYKDAIVYDLNGDGTIDSNDKDADGKYQVFSYITPTTRWSNDQIKRAEAYFDSARGAPISLSVRNDVLEETIWGGHIQVSPVVGSHIGFTTYTALYNNAHFVVPQGNDLANYLILNADDYGKWKAPNSEVASLYATKTDDYKRDYRRVMGLDWGTTLGNTSLSGEYAELSVDGDDAKFGDDPGALLVSSYTQFENLYLVSLYRDYDLGFDNPYARGFSEHEKFDNSIFDNDSYVTGNALLTDLYLNSAQAQAERGIYFETRYQFSDYLLLNRTYLDLWERKCDWRKSLRFQGELEFRPLFQVRFRLKHKYQVNRYQDQADRGRSTSNETTFLTRFYLSARDRLDLEYRYNTVKSPPYVHLTNPATAGQDNLAQAQTLIHGDYIGVDYQHNFNDRLSVEGALIFWNGHGVSHWDWEDMEIDFMGQQGTKMWFTVHDRIGKNLWLSLKYKIKNYRTQEYWLRKWWNDPLYVEGDDDITDYAQSYFERVEKQEHDIRLQLDWKF